MALLNLGWAIAVGLVKNAAIGWARADAVMDAHVFLVLHDAVGNARIAHLQALVGPTIPPVPFANAEQRAARENPLGPICQYSLCTVRLSPKPN